MLCSRDFRFSFLVVSFALGLFLLDPGQSHAQDREATVHAGSPPAPIVHELEQPSGVTFEARQWGGPWLHGWETMEGYTIVRDESSTWVYADQDAQGNLVPTNQRVGEDSPPAVQRQLRPSSSAPQRQQAQEKAKASASVQETYPSTGSIDVPVILIDFDDTNPSETQADFDELMFGDDPAVADGPGSFSDYYDEVSYGELDVNGEVLGWYTANNNHDYYGENDANDNDKNPGELVKEAVEAADDDVDFSQFDNDGDGEVDGVMVVHQGTGEEASGDDDDIWSHRWSLSGAGVGSIDVDGVTVDSYALQPEIYAHDNGMTTIGVIAHEFGHLLGLRDLYDTDGTSEGIGEWGLMGSGSWNETNRAGDTPAHLSAWGKWRLGWISPTQVDGFMDAEVIEPAHAEADVYQLLDNPGGVEEPGGTGEYFLVETREHDNFDAGLPGEGLVVWHIDESQGSNDNEAHKLVDLEAADGNQDLDNPSNGGGNRGDGGDPFPGSTGKTLFDETTDPNSKLYNGDPSGVGVADIQTGSMEADLSVFEIVNPTVDNPVTVGDKDNPKKTDVVVKGVAPGAKKDEFEVRIGGEQADVVTVTERSNDYILEVDPPTKDEDGLYQLWTRYAPNQHDATANPNKAQATTSEENAVRYGEALADIPLVIDRSGSMSGSNMDAAKSAAKQFVQLMDLDNMIGVVSFSSSAQVDYPLTEVTDQSIKDEAQNAIDGLSASGFTSVGGGLQTGQDQLDSNGADDHEHAVVLMSDGFENRSPYVSDVLPNIPAKTDVYTIAFGSSPDEALLQSLANQTGGQYSRTSDQSDLQRIYNQILGQITGQQTIASQSGSVEEGESEDVPAKIDETVSEADFSVSWGSGDLNVTIKRPDGSTVDPDEADNISHSSGDTFEAYEVKDPEVGEWTTTVEGVSGISFGGESFTASVSGVSDLNFKAHFDKNQYSTGQAMTVLVSLSEGDQPVTGASVSATVQSPSQSISDWEPVNGDLMPSDGRKPMTEVNASDDGAETITLYDDGKHGDGKADDGVYGNLYTKTSGTGSYIFDFQAQGTTSQNNEFTRSEQRSSFVEPSTSSGEIAGTINHSGGETVHIRVWQNNSDLIGNPDYQTTISNPGDYSFSNLPDGDYYLAAFMEDDDNGTLDVTDPRGVYGDDDPERVTISSGETVSNIDIELEAPQYPDEIAADVDVSFGNASQSEDYRLVALPGAVAQDLSNVVDGDAGVEWQAYWDDGSDEDFLVKYDGSSTFDFQDGKGFWLTSSDGWDFQESIPTINLQNDGTATIDLHSGWNIISNPLDKDFPWQDVDAANSASLQPLWAYRGGSFEQVATFRSAEKGEAYYFFNDEGLDELKVAYPDPGFPGQGTSSPQRAKEAELQTVTLTAATSSDDVSSSVRLGKAKTAKGGKDTLDWVAPPGRFSDMSLRLQAPEAASEEEDVSRQQLWARDIRPAGAEEERYYLELEGEPGSVVYLTTKGAEALSAQEIVVVDPSTGRSHDLHSGDPFEVTVSDGTTNLLVAIGENVDVEDALSAASPEKLDLTVYPNPVSGQGTLQYALPESEDIQLVLYDALGRRVTLLQKGEQESGRHQVEFQTQQFSSGLYIVRLETSNQAVTEQVTIVR